MNITYEINRLGEKTFFQNAWNNVNNNMVQWNSMFKIKFVSKFYESAFNSYMDGLVQYRGNSGESAI